MNTMVVMYAKCVDIHLMIYCHVIGMFEDTLLPPPCLSPSRHLLAMLLGTLSGGSRPQRGGGPEASRGRAKRPYGATRKDESDILTIDTETLNQTVILLCKGYLQNTQELRKLKAIAMTQMLVATESHYVVNGKEEIDAFVKKAKSYSGTPENRIKSLGLPSVLIFNRWLAMILEKLSPSHESHIAITTFCTKYGKAPEPLEELSLQVPHVMITRPWDKKFRKIEIGLRGEALELFNLHVLPQFKSEKGYRLLQGLAPRGQLERQIQTFLDNQLGKEDMEEES